MSSFAAVAKIPSHVLMEDKCRIGPDLIMSDSDALHKAIYGFSSKACFDTFCANSDRALAPYPLVCGYLENQIEEAGDELTLVVLDATGPTDPTLHAATMEDVLLASQKKMPHVTARHLLAADPHSNSYRLAEISPVLNDS